jgi:hypothetical protein
VRQYQRDEKKGGLFTKIEKAARKDLSMMLFIDHQFDVMIADLVEALASVFLVGQDLRYLAGIDANIENANRFEPEEALTLAILLLLASGPAHLLKANGKKEEDFLGKEFAARVGELRANYKARNLTDTLFKGDPSQMIIRGHLAFVTSILGKTLGTATLNGNTGENFDAIIGRNGR